ncbi:MAG TPA: cupin domain-containing protein [Polyangiaceae bacterium]|nr:cupin domain-containing protein [Polyangiaceae bacterium]
MKSDGFLEVAGADLVWQASPSPQVWRKRLFHAGAPEAGTVTSIVRYEAGSRFHEHGHPEGEEILVLSGTFSDERGDFGAGSYMLNPEGFRHAPFSVEGCVLFVKLRQYPGLDRERVLIQTATGSWHERFPGVRSQTLYRSAQYPDHIRLTELAPGAEPPTVALPEGEEVFVLRGELSDEHGTHGSHSWLRYPAGASHTPRSPGGCLLYVCSPAGSRSTGSDARTQN